ncbi:MAG: efflux RND transporter permease subunit, partial [Alphaproteobacteria bacterium]|nr:efflux RND transporter permease subunit [Alphaproteobacteria bacterium]
MSVSDWFISRPVATSLLMAGIVAIGGVAYPQLPVSSLPDVEFPTISVSASLPGASPETMASAVATPLETQFAAVPGVTQMTSSSGLGSTNVTLQFDLSVDINAAAGDVQTAINAASGLLPRQLPSPPTFRKVNPTEAPILIISLQSDKYPLTIVDNYAETVLAQHISQINGVGQVVVTGQQKPAVRIQIDPAKLAAVNLGLEDVRNVLASATVDQPKGTFEGPHQSFIIYTNDQLLSAEPWNDVVVAYENGHVSPIGYAATNVPTAVSTSTQVQNGSPVRIRDIGRAVDGPENALVASWQNNNRGILLIISKQPNSNVITVVRDIQAALPQLRASIPAGININIIMDRTQTIAASINDIQLTLLLTIVLVVAVIFLFLRTLWTTVIAGIAIPISILGTFALMYLAGYSLDNLSLMGLAIAVGFVVDDAIVMLENVYRHIELGEE